ncbi:MAG: HAMP domain-containing protein [Planctomycetaceae bacterium]|nr:MAG: HAMP domain-containing protein [Planctomycetaceae bacterium]
MLARRTIRTKLLVVLGLMLMIVGLLATSGFWGLYRYRGLADAISLQAEEISYARRLNRSATSIRDIVHRIRRLHAETRLHDDSPLLATRMDNEIKCFRDSLDEFERLLKSFRRKLDSARPDQMLFIDPEERSTRIREMTVQLGRVSEIYSQRWFTWDDVLQESIHEELDELTRQTEQWTTLVHEGMAAFSSDVRVGLQTWIAVAWSCLVGSICMFVTLCWLFHSLVVKPFRTLLDGSRLVAVGSYDHRIDLGTGDELSELAGVVNQMTQSFQTTCVMLENERADLDRQVRDRTREVVQREQLASVGFLAAGVAHEINNPLASIAWSAEALESRLHDTIHGEGELRQIPADHATLLGTNLRRIQDEAYRCKGITEKLLDFSRLGNLEKASVNLCELIRDVVAIVGTLGQYRCKTLRVDCPAQIEAMVNGQQIRQVALNLITNALESVDADGEVQIRVRQQPESVLLTVEDDGCGMTEEVLENLFEPFFTRRRDGKGTGLGLSITHRIVTQHGGTLTAHSDGPGHGSRFRLELPIESAIDVSRESPTEGFCVRLPALPGASTAAAEIPQPQPGPPVGRVADSLTPSPNPIADRAEESIHESCRAA